MKVLITGASGLLGRAIKREFEKNASWDILGLGFSRLAGGLKKVDLTNPQDLNQVINDFKPDVVCLLYTSPSPRDQRGSRMPSSA